jgi:hypothetical protein
VRPQSGRQLPLAVMRYKAQTNTESLGIGNPLGASNDKRTQDNFSTLPLLCHKQTAGKKNPEQSRTEPNGCRIIRIIAAELKPSAPKSVYPAVL